MTAATRSTSHQRRGLHPEPPSLLYVIKQLELAIRARLDELLRRDNMTALQYTALTVLDRHDGLSSAQLARDSFVTAQTMSDMVSALERRGLIRRARRPENRRELQINLTDEGRALLARYAEPVRRIEAELTAGLTSRQAEQFRCFVEHGRQALS